MKQTVDAVTRLVPLSLRVSAASMRELEGLAMPADGLVAAPFAQTMDNAEKDENAPGGPPALQARQDVRDIKVVATDGASLTAVAEAARLDAIAAIVTDADSSEARNDAIRQRWASLPISELKGPMTRALALAELIGHSTDAS